MDAEAAVPPDGTLNDALDRTKREAVENVLAQADGNVADAAATLGILRTSLYRIMKRHGIVSPKRSKR